MLAMAALNTSAKLESETRNSKKRQKQPEISLIRHLSFFSQSGSFLTPAPVLLHSFEGANGASSSTGL